jgi:hypothetical protein
MKLISIQHIVRQMVQLSGRFPVVLLITLIGTTSAIAMIMIDMRTEDPAMKETLIVLAKVVAIALLAFPWVTLVTLLTERYQPNSRYQYLLQVGSALLISTYAFFFPTDSADYSVFVDLRLFLLTVVGTLLFLTVPFDRGDSQSLWRYLATDVRGAIIAFVFAVGLGAGLTLSIFAIWYLFKIGGRDDEEILMMIWQFMIGIVASWIFLSKLPSPKEKPTLEKLPYIIERFVSIVWLPIVVIFFIILYVYLGTIFTTWEWPKGGVIYWILSFSIVGILSSMVSCGDLNPPRWKRWYFRIFFASMLPIMAMYFTAIGLRIQQYGVTESRYLVAIGGLWLVIVSFYYLFSRAKKIQFIPYLTASFLFFSVVGPWSMFSASMFSQVDRLGDLLTTHEILVNGKIVPMTSGVIPSEDYYNIRSMLDYVIEHRGVEKIQPWFDKDLSQGANSLSMISSRAFDMLSLRSDEREPVDERFYFNQSEPKNRSSRDIRGFNFILSDLVLGRYGVFQASVSDLGLLQFALGTEAAIEITQSIEGQKDPQTLAVMNLSPLISELINQYCTNRTDVDPSKLFVYFDNEKVKFKILIDQLGGKRATRRLCLTVWHSSFWVW